MAVLKRLFVCCFLQLLYSQYMTTVFQLDNDTYALGVLSTLKLHVILYCLDIEDSDDTESQALIIVVVIIVVVFILLILISLVAFYCWRKNTRKPYV